MFNSSVLSQSWKQVFNTENLWWVSKNVGVICKLWKIRSLAPGCQQSVLKLACLCCAGLPEFFCVPVSIGCRVNVLRLPRRIWFGHAKMRPWSSNHKRMSSWWSRFVVYFSFLWSISQLRYKLVTCSWLVSGIPLVFFCCIGGLGVYIRKRTVVTKSCYVVVDGASSKFSFSSCSCPTRLPQVPVGQNPSFPAGISSQYKYTSIKSCTELQFILVTWMVWKERNHLVFQRAPDG